MSDNMEEIIEDPSEILRQGNTFLKSDWLRVAAHYEVELRGGWTKREVRAAVERNLRARLGADEQEENEPPSESEDLPEEEAAEADQSEEERVARLQLELEFRREQAALEREDRLRREEREERRRREEREHEIQLAKLRAGVRGNGNADDAFYKAKSMVPKFSESEPEDFFTAFEATARTLEWQERHWSLLAHTVFPGRALAAYLSLEENAREDYYRVKDEVLKAYEVTAEHYRNKFRTIRRDQGERFAEYIHVLDRNIAKWWKTAGADTLEKARELCLLEQFLQGVSPEVRLYLREKQVSTPAQAASMAEDYELVAKTGREANRSGREVNRARSKHGEAMASLNKPTRCMKCGIQGHLAWQCMYSGGGGNDHRSLARRSKCYNCGQVGHLSLACPRKNASSKWQSHGPGKGPGSNACVTLAPMGRSEGWRGRISGSKEVDMRYQPYTKEGYVSVEGSGLRRVPIRIMGASHSLILRRILPGITPDKKIRLVGLGAVVDAPQVNIVIEVEGKKRKATVCLAEKLPIEGVEMLLGNDFGSKMTAQNFLLEEGEGKGVVPPNEHGRSTGNFSISQMTKPSGRKDAAMEVEGEETGGLDKEIPIPAEPQQRMEQRKYIVEMGRFLSITQKTQPRGVLRTSTQGEIAGGAEGVAVVTRGMANKMRVRQEEAQDSAGLDGVSGLFSTPQEKPDGLVESAAGEAEEPEGGSGRTKGRVALPLTRKELVEAQREDPELVPLLSKAITSEEAEREAVCFYVDRGLLKRKWSKPQTPGTEDHAVHQVVVPKRFREEVTRVAHEEIVAHMGAKKTGEVVSNYFYWPKIHKSVGDFVRKCVICQSCAGQPPIRAPLQPIPVVGEPFNKLVIDIVGPLPRTRSGNEYLLTLMCATTRYADAVPISSCKARRLIPRLMDIFSKFGVPKIIQTDRGSNFMGKLFQRALSKMGITHVTSTAYHPQSQGCLERFHKTLKQILTKFCHQNDKDWDEGVQVALYAIRTARHEGLGYSPFELMFGRKPRENLRILCESYEDEDGLENIGDYVQKLKDRMRCAHELARKNLEISQGKMKKYYDKKSKLREFQEGDSVLLFDGTRGRPLQAKYEGPYVVLRRLGPVNYLLSTPGRRRSTRSVHVNLLKRFEKEGAAVAAIGDDLEELPEQTVIHGCGTDDFAVGKGQPRLANSLAMEGLGERLLHLEEAQRGEITRMLTNFACIMQDIPTRTHQIQHDISLVEGAQPVKQNPYRICPAKREKMRREVSYLLENGLAAPSCSPWASPCLLVPKGDGSVRLCTDYRRLNKVTVADAYPMPRLDDLIDEVSSARYLTKIDLLRGYYQVPLTDRAREASAFVTPDGLYEYLVMPFGMMNSGSTFQRMANELVRGLAGVKVYVDDLIVFSDTWESHIERLRALFSRLSEANLTINLPKCEFAHATVVYLGHRVGRGGIKPLEAKVKDILEFKPPRNKRGLRKFLGLIGFYRRFCRNFASTAAPLTDLLSTSKAFMWSEACNQAFEDLKALLTSTPVLHAPRFEEPFVICVDASDVGIGGVLGQEENGEMRPVAYFSQKLLKHQRKYSAIEKEALAVIKALEKFEVYTGGKIVVYTDHNPLAFVERMKNKNQRLARWAVALQDKNLEIRHIPGKQNVVADALSRPN